MTIERIQVGQAEQYRAVRLRSLQDSPAAFRTTYAEASQRDMVSWIAQADGFAIANDRCAYFAIEDGTIVGLTAFYGSTTEAGRGEIMQVWVQADHRGGPLAPALLGAVLDWAATQGFHHIDSRVAKGNDRARRFYEKQGFRWISADPTNGEVLLTRLIDPVTKPA